MEWTRQIAHWWVDYLAAATALLAIVLIAGGVIRQPAQRMAMAWSATIVLLVLAVCCAVPGWPRLALVANASEAGGGETAIKPEAEQEAQPGTMTVRQWMTAKPEPKVGSLEAVLRRGEHSDASKDSPTKPQTSAGSFDWLKFVSWSLVAGSLASVAW